MGDHTLHPGGFANYAGGGPELCRRHFREKSLNARAIYFFVVSKCQMQRPLERQIFPTWYMRQDAGNKSLHVAGATAVYTIGAQGGFERIGAPVLGSNGHDIRVTRENDSIVGSGSNGGEEVGLSLVSIVNEPGCNSVRA